MYSTLWSDFIGTIGTILETTVDRFTTKVILGIKLSSVNPGFLQLPWHEPTSSIEPVDLVRILT